MPLEHPGFLHSQPAVVVDLLTTYVEPTLCQVPFLALDRPGFSDPHNNHHYPLSTGGN